ncbi:unnamed protein product [Bemisia tabaci]|uniref:Uncharacterized protein n=1 Tax=Bemisia tabaci TaxID=7038 RepID=A0A9P0A156_BEMTA|nr:unnamed protein product [Bemisia tabaci]
MSPSKKPSKLRTQSTLDTPSINTLSDDSVKFLIHRPMELRKLLGASPSPASDLRTKDHPPPFSYQISAKTGKLVFELLESHSNGELCLSIKSIQYILKYTYKSSNQAPFTIKNKFDEILRNKRINKSKCKTQSSARTAEIMCDSKETKTNQVEGDRLMLNLPASVAGGGGE